MVNTLRHSSKFETGLFLSILLSFFINISNCYFATTNGVYEKLFGDFAETFGDYEEMVGDFAEIFGVYKTTNSDYEKAFGDYKT